MMLRCFVDDRTLATLQRVARETGRPIEDLAEAAIAEAALKAERDAAPAVVLVGRGLSDIGDGGIV